MRRVGIVVTGIVQGVGFRYFCSKHAEHLGITGSVENRPDGSVRVEAQGDEPALLEFTALLRKGPRNAIVLGFEEQELPVIESESLLEIR
jgi:acylphosphatase